MNCRPDVTSLPHLFSVPGRPSDSIPRQMHKVEMKVQGPPKLTASTVNPTRSRTKQCCEGFARGELAVFQAIVFAFHFDGVERAGRLRSSPSRMRSCMDFASCF